MLGLSFDNIDRKSASFLLKRDRTKAPREITANPALLTYKWRRLLFAVRLTNPDGLANLITINPKRLAGAKGWE